MSNLVTYAKQQTIKPISANNQTRFDQIAKEVEEYELRRLLGPAFLQDIQTNPGNYTDLLDGCDYENSDGDTVAHKGLRYVLSYMIFSKYIGESSIFDTFSGLVQKTRTDSEIISEGTMRRLQEENRAIALTEWSLIKEYLDLNILTYTLWQKAYRKIYRPRITGIKRTSYG